jgi:peroxiredoxin
MFCREQAVQLHREKDRIHAAGAELVMVGNGNRHFAAGFVKDLGLTIPLYVDTKRDAYKALGFKRSLTSLMTPTTLANAARALKSGFRQGKTQGDAVQLGGVLVVRPGGEVVFRYASDAPGDHPPVDKILAALEKK